MRCGWQRRQAGQRLTSAPADLEAVVSGECIGLVERVYLVENQRVLFDDVDTDAYLRDALIELVEGLEKLP